MTSPPVRRMVASVAALSLLWVTASSFRPAPEPVSIARPPDAAVTRADVLEPPAMGSPALVPGRSQQLPSTRSLPTEDPSPRDVEPAATDGNEPAEDRPTTIDTPPRSLYLAIGHGWAADGRLQPGSINPRSGHHEIDTAAVIVDAMLSVLEQAPNLRLWAESGRDHPNLVGSVNRANRHGADDCIEIHQEWHKAPPGAFAHWYPGSRSAEALANRLVHGLRHDGVETRHKWHRPRPGLYFLRKTTCRAVLVEVGRIGDFTDEELRQFGRTLARSYIADIQDQF